MATEAEIRFWRERQRSLSLKVHEDMVRAVPPKRETLQALQGVEGLLQRLILATPTAQQL